MSKIKVQQPVIHLPSFKEYRISGAELAKKYEALGAVRSLVINYPGMVNVNSSAYVNVVGVTTATV
ncbi:unnamed protein product [marine sediment metagenome]|uniref:Uncharacterized protein n=1 Tax=marine sediment metagenome TaxID=412755 RepID=X1NXN0_9ZZZZ